MRKIIDEINDSAIYGTIIHPVKGDYLVVVTHLGNEHEYYFNTLSTAEQFFYGTCEDVMSGLAYNVSSVAFFTIMNQKLYLVQPPFIYGEKENNG